MPSSIAAAAVPMPAPYRQFNNFAAACSRKPPRHQTCDSLATGDLSLQLTNDKITGNYASADGGGIYNEAGAFPIGVLTLAHTTVSSNDAGSLGGGIYNAGAVAAADTTISRNTARGGGGIYQIEGDGYGVRLTRSAVLHNIPDNCEPPGTIMGCTG